MTESLTQQILAQLALLTTSVTAHHSSHIGIDDKIAAMYKILVTGDPPLPEIVRKHELWIVEHDKEKTEIRQSGISRDLMATQSQQKDRSDAVAFRRQLTTVVITIVGTQIVGFIVLAIEIALKMK
jgi:hypothetical protein